MIIGQHSILYTTDADADRAFFRDILQFPATDAGDGWLIFRMPPAELALHPTDGAPTHEIFLMCDNVHATMETLQERGVEFTTPVTDQGWGLMTHLKLPSGAVLGVYEPRHPTAI